MTALLNLLSCFVQYFLHFSTPLPSNRTVLICCTTSWPPLLYSPSLFSYSALHLHVDPMHFFSTAFSSTTSKCKMHDALTLYNSSSSLSASSSSPYHASFSSSPTPFMLLRSRHDAGLCKVTPETGQIMLFFTLIFIHVIFS